MSDVQRLVLQSARGDWISDYEVQGDFQAELGLERSEAYRSMVPKVRDWIQRGVLVPGDMLDGFVAWAGSSGDLAVRFESCAAELQILTRPGQICWFDIGPHVSAELAQLDANYPGG